MSIHHAELEKALLVIYQKNLNFLKENFFDIYLEVETLSSNIISNKYEQQYSLEVVNGYFDILNLKNNGYYYATNSYIDAEKRAKKIDYSVSSSLDLLRKDGNSQKLAKAYEMKDVMPIIDFINSKVDLENVQFEKIMKFMYIGVGLGYHLQEIDKKIKSYTTLIIEPELEIFRLSLFTTDYSIFEEGNRTLVLSIGDDIKKRNDAFAQFYHYHEYMNYNIKHYCLLQNLEYIKQEVIDFFGTNFVFSFPYTAVLTNVERTVGFIKDRNRFLVLKDIEEKKIIGDKKVLIISAGPSLDNYIDDIKKYQDKFIIVCVDVIVRKLEEHNIVPDIVFSIDPSHLCADFLTTKDPDFLKESAIVLLSQQHPDVIEVLKERNLKFYFSQFAAVVEEIGSLGSMPNVGTFAFQAMIRLGAKELYLIANDAAFNQETGARYAKGSSYVQTEKIESKDENEDIISHDDVVEVKGNLRDIVKTNRSLLDIKYSYDLSISFLEAYEYKAYNLSDGVYIDGIEPLEKKYFLEKVETLDSLDLHTIQSFDSISKVLDLACYKNDIKIMNSIIQRAKKFQKLKIHSKEEFLEKKIDMMIWILTQTKKLSIQLYGNIFLQYTSLVDAYINFTINLRQKDLYTKENLALLRDYWAKGLISVFKDLKASISYERK